MPATRGADGSASAPRGAFALVLHSHIPYARKAGRWPHGEEWIHEAATQSYLPLLAALHDLADEGVRYRLTFSITPVLAEQLVDPDVLANIDAYIDGRRERAERDIARFEREGDPTRAYVAAFHRGRFIWLLEQFRTRFRRDLIGAIRKLQDSGHLELATSAATHGYLPLFERDSSIEGQIRTAMRAHRRHFGRDAESFWLPECAYRPERMTADRTRRPGLETFLAGQGVRVFFVETHAVMGGEPVGKAAGDALGPYRDFARRGPTEVAPAAGRTTFQPYYAGASTVAALGRNRATGVQVWSADHGYPGDFLYREFHKKDSESGLHYWRVSGVDVDLGEKELYEPQPALERTKAHAQHFASLVEQEIRQYHAESGRHGILCAAYDTELFGHWWFEGVDWIKAVLRRLSESDGVEMCGAAEYVRRHPPEERISLPESSWGLNGSHVTWLNADTQSMWPAVNSAQRRIEAIASRGAPLDELTSRALAQLARELLLLESSDWPFLVTTRQAREYAERRFSAHLERFERLAMQLERGDIDAGYVDELWERDKIFPDIQIQDFRPPPHMANTPARAVP